MQTNKFIEDLGDAGIVALIKSVQKIMETPGKFTTGEMIDMLLDPLEADDMVKARVAILVQTVIHNMNEMNKHGRH